MDAAEGGAGVDGVARAFRVGRDLDRFAKQTQGFVQRWGEIYGTAGRILDPNCGSNADCLNTFMAIGGVFGGGGGGAATAELAAVMKSPRLLAAMTPAQLRLFIFRLHVSTSDGGTALQRSTIRPIKMWKPTMICPVCGADNRGVLRKFAWRLHRPTLCEVCRSPLPRGGDWIVSAVLTPGAFILAFAFIFGGAVGALVTLILLVAIAETTAVAFAQPPKR